MTISAERPKFCSLDHTVIDVEHEDCDARNLRNAFGCFATGIAVVATRASDGKREGLTINSFSSLSLEPPLVLWSLRKQAPSLDSFASSSHFSVSVLDRSQKALSDHFSKPRPDKFHGVQHGEGLGGCPVISDALATFECKRTEMIEAGDHVIFIGQVLRACYTQSTPLLYIGGRYATPCSGAIA